MTFVFPINFNTVYRKKGEGDEELSPPSGLCLTQEENILLADDFNHRIQVYDQQFNLVTNFGEKGKDIGQLQYPKGLALDKEGNIFVADSWNHRVQKFDPQGKVLQSFGSCGDDKGELNEPYDILVDTSGTLIVVERYNHRIQFFDMDGKSLGWVGQRGTTLEEKLADLYETPSDLIAPPLFEFPTSIARDSCGNFFVTDSGNHRIHKFNNRWEKILTFGESGTEPGQFQYPLCISIASNDLLYIADLNNNRIQIFTCFGQYLQAIDNADIALEAPCLTLVDSAGNLFVGSTFDTKIAKYKVSLEEEDTLSENLSKQEPPTPEFFNYYSLVQEKNKNKAKSFAALEKTLKLLDDPAKDINMQPPLRLGRLAFAGIEITESSLNLAIPLIEQSLDKARIEMLSSFEIWQETAQKYNEQQIKEQDLIQKDPQGLRDFNHDLYICEQEERKYFRDTRSKFNSFRKTSQQLYDFIYHFSESKISETQRENLTKLMSRQWKASTDIIKDYFDEKEKSEESMVEILGNQGDGQLPSFLIKYYYNCRIMDLLLQLQFPLKAHCQIVKVLARQAANSEKTQELVRGLTSKSVFTETAIRILIRFHEQWQILEYLEPQFLETMDVTLPHWVDEDITLLEPSIDDFSPVVFDSENLDIAKVSQIVQAQACEIKLEDGILSWGPMQYKLDSLTNKKNELISKGLATLEAQSVFQDKTEELLIQLDELGQQRRDLDAQLKQVGMEDKTTPISIYNNIAIIEFQLNLMRRMIKGIEINENLNLHQLVVGSAIVKTLNPGQQDSQLFDAIKSYSEKIKIQIQEIFRERRSKHFEMPEYIKSKSKQLPHLKFLILMNPLG
ncbi:MAG: NHL repeat-containing protein [Nitrospinota bacterium]|nr:NHL repeat-containing protein [Nitrospinota bacterium]